jgi:hypothetical protein
VDSGLDKSILHRGTGTFAYQHPPPTNPHEKFRLGWDYLVLHEPVTVRIANIRFLAGYRREWLVNQNVLADLRGRRTDLIGRSIGAVEESLGGYPHPLVRSALLSMLWRREFEVNLDVRLERSTVLEAAS